MMRLAQALGVVALCSSLAALPGWAQDASAAASGPPSLRYERARALAQTGATEAALAEFEALLAQYPNDADYLLGQAQMQARLNRVDAAIDSAERALALAPDYEDVWQLRLQLAERAGDPAAAALRTEAAERFPAATWWQRAPSAREYRRWVSSGYGTERLSNGAPEWSREFLRVDWQSASNRALFAELSRSERFEAGDNALAVGGAWQALPQWQIGASLSVADAARFLPDRELAVEAMRRLPQGWSATLAVRGRDYAAGDVSSFSVTSEKYVAAFRVAYRVDRSRLAGGDSALTHALMATWYQSDRRNFGVTLGAGEEIESIGLDRLLRTSVSNLTLTGNETFSPRLSLGWWLGTHEQGDFYRRDYAGLSVRVGF